MLQGITLLVALYASGSHRRVIIVAAVLTLAGLVAAAAAALSDGDVGSGTIVLVQLALVVVAPVAIARALLRQHEIDVRTVFGAICIYLLMGLSFAFAYGAIGAFSDEPFFVQQSTANTADYVYFSYVTQATVGYGDLTARNDLGRSIAVVEALSGQLYLVTVVALLVSRVTPRRIEGGDGTANPPPPLEDDQA